MIFYFVNYEIFTVGSNSGHGKNQMTVKTTNAQMSSYTSTQHSTNPPVSASTTLHVQQSTKTSTKRLSVPSVQPLITKPAPSTTILHVQQSTKKSTKAPPAFSVQPLITKPAPTSTTLHVQQSTETSTKHLRTKPTPASTTFHVQQSTKKSTISPPAFSVQPSITKPDPLSVTTSRSPITHSSISPQTSNLVCNKVFYIDNETSGYIDSSELSETFDIQCLWYIHAPEGYTIRFHFADFNLKEFAYCLHDSVIIVDGPEPGIAAYGPFCGTNAPSDINTSTNISKIIFQLDPINGTSGFTVQFSAVGQ